MKFARITFYVAFVWGVFILTPLFFMYDVIGQKDPPPITHPGFFYGFLTAGLSWQLVFLLIAGDPVRFRKVMLPSVAEKFSYALAFTFLYMRGRIHPQDLAFAAVDAVFGVLFLIAFYRTKS